MILSTNVSKRRKLSPSSKNRRAMIDSTHCSQCNGLLIEIDFYGEWLVGCIECNRWTRDGWIFIQLTEEDLEALKTLPLKEGYG
jgi:hypothetical protein